MKVKDRARPKVPTVEPGVYFAVCIGVIDLGEQYSEKFKNYSNRVQFVWELPSETIEVEGKQEPKQLSKEFAIATKKNSGLRTFISSWNSKAYTDEEFQEVELFDQIGKACQLNVVISESGEYANVDSVMPIPKGFTAPESRTTPILWDMDNWNDEVFKTLPEWVQDKIKKSTQYQREHTPTDSIEVKPQAEPAAPSASVPATMTGGAPF